jgi:hypothetical protein
MRGSGTTHGTNEKLTQRFYWKIPQKETIWKRDVDGMFLK